MSQSVLDPEIRKILIENAHLQLFEPEGARGLDYLTNRGIVEGSIREWNLGYCPSFVNDMIFNDRIIIPYCDQHNRAIAVAARKIENEKPYWWNEKFPKGDFLFGLNKTKKNIFYNNLAIVVEGQFDVISLYQHGITIAVGLCGSSLNEHRINLLSRYCNRVILAMDQDANQAGQIAAGTIFELLKRRNFHIYHWYLSKNEDPDSYVRKNGGENCKKQISNILKKYKFKTKKFKQSYNFGE